MGCRIKLPKNMSQNGLLECLRYSLPPNSLSYCGPSGTNDLVKYRRLESGDQGLFANLSQFHTLYAYLSFIAYENNIRDPFDIRVVKAYWIGNSLLTKFDPRRFYYYLRDKLNLKKRLSRQQLENLFGKIPDGALPHHAFHVFNVPWRTGYLPIEHTLDTMNSCRIGCGKVISRKQGQIVVETQPLMYKEGILRLGKSVQRKIGSKISKVNLEDKVLVGDWVSFHWGIICNKITTEEVTGLNYYTQLAVDLANEDIRRREHFG